MKNLTLKQFRYFQALAHFKHFGRAAEASAISQPALSMQIKELETSLGTPLFERSAREIRLTSFGMEFASRAGEILRSIDEIGDLARATSERLSGRLRIGIIPTIAPYMLPKIITQLSQSYDDLELQIRETLTPKLIQELSDGRIDTAILALPVSEPAFSEVALFEEDFVLIRHKNDADKPVPNNTDLKEMRLLLLEEGHCFRDQALSFCNLPTAVPREGLDGSSLSTLVQLVGAGMGVTLLPQMAVPVETRAADVSVSRLIGKQPSRKIGMIWRKTNPLSNQLHKIANLVGKLAPPKSLEAKNHSSLRRA